MEEDSLLVQVDKEGGMVAGAAKVAAVVVKAFLPAAASVGGDKMWEAPENKGLIKWLSVTANAELIGPSLGLIIHEPVFAVLSYLASRAGSLAIEMTAARRFQAKPKA